MAKRFRTIDFLPDDHDDEEEPYSSDEDEDYVPIESNISDEGDSTTSESDASAELDRHGERQEDITSQNIWYLSKDKRIQYSSQEPPPNVRVSSCAILHNKPGVTLHASSRVTDAVSSFLLFIEPIEKIVLDMTNLYGFRKYERNWNNIDLPTLRAYFGLLLLAGVYRSHGECLTELWDDYNGRPIFKATMPLKKFKLINQCLRFDDRSDRIERRARDKLAPIRNIFDKWAHNLKVMYNPGHCVTVDEQLIPFRGKSPFTQYIPTKPYKYGIKAWVVCDSESYYTYNIQIYTGKDRNCKAETNQGKRVVLDLVENLAGRNVTCDNFFTSHDLAVELKTRKMTIVGTLRKNRKEIPPVLLDMKNKPIYYSEFVFNHSLRSTMVSYVPKKRRFVTLLNTYHTRTQVNEDGKKKPEIIEYYNCTKGGVDTLDKLIGTYRCKRKVNRWPMAVFANMLDISAYNAFVLFTALNPNWNINKKSFRRRLFLLEIGHSLVRSEIETRERIPHGENAAAVVRDVRGLPPEIPSTSSNTRLTKTVPSKKGHDVIYVLTNLMQMHILHVAISAKKLCAIIIDF